VKGDAAGGESVPDGAPEFRHLEKHEVGVDMLVK
jgi:hypothetical protein